MASELHFNIADLFESVVDVIPDRVAVVCGERRLTFAELDARANRVAHALAARGIGPGDHVGLYLYNSTEFLEVMLGAFKLRAVPININYRYVEDELRFLCDNADLAALVHQAELTPRVAAVVHDLPSLRVIWSVADGSSHRAPPAHDFETLVAGAKDTRGFTPRTGDDAYIVYTGGTTGMPRGVIWRHEDVFFAGLQGGNPGGAHIAQPSGLADLVRAKEEGEALTFMITAPFIHGAAQWGALIGLFGGGKVVLVPGKSFNAPLAARLIDDEKVNTMLMVGDAMGRPLADALRAARGTLDVSSLMVIASAGAVLSDSVREELSTELPETMILNSFGATETGHQGSMYPGDAAPGKLCLYMDETTTVLGEDLRPLEPGSGRTGRLARRGHLPVGYYKDPAKTAATFLLVDGERWVVPGDLATIEEDGRITIFGRDAMCINTGGEKVFAEEVENALKAHPDVFDAVVVGVRDERWGQRVVAVVQPRDDATLALPLLDAHCRAKLAAYKVPRELHTVAVLVRQPSGKPDYRWAHAVALGQTPSSTPQPASSLRVERGVS
jgi:acyl-CoA synthetase (AMP-forming)/AMP-acid ligase II